MNKGISTNNSLLFKSQIRPYYSYEAFAALILLTVCFAIILPDLFFLRLSPMGGTTYTIKDPSVSWAAFMPAFREFRYELFEHSNILWSNLRSLGMPMLGNGVQGAPLFPLNLALIWLPDTLYWSIMPVSRVILIGLGCFLLCRKVFGLSLTASFAFALFAGFNLNVMRWINHPWSNGLLAGIWYTYFCCTLFLNASSKRRILFWHWLGLVISVFGMITNGFPEASALAALLAVFIFISFILSNWSHCKNVFLKALTLIIGAHIVGLSLAAVQIFALLEFIDYAGALNLREGFIGKTFRQDEMVPYALSQFSHFWVSSELTKYLSFSTGLFGTFFFIRGLCLWLSTSKHPWIGISSLLMMILFISKSFGLIGFIETIFANTPVLAQSHFPLYFSPLFYFGVAYFVALGVESYLNIFDKTKQQKIISIIVSCFATLSVFLLTLANLHEFSEVGLSTIISNFLAPELRHLIIFTIGAGFLITYQIINARWQFIANTKTKKTFSIAALCLIIVSCFVSEMTINHFKRHAKINSWSLNLTSDFTTTLNNAINNSPVPQHELRSNDRNGKYVEYGISIVDNGVSAIMPYDQRLIRDGIFQTKYSGYWPIDNARRSWSWATLSTNLFLIDTTPKINYEWSQLEPAPKMSLFNNTQLAEINLPRSQPLVLNGSVQGNFLIGSDVKLAVHFKGSTHEFWIDANIANRHHLKTHKIRRTTKIGWRIYALNDWFIDDQYTMTIRAIEKRSNSYGDTLSSTVNLIDNNGSSQQFSYYPNLLDAPLLATSENERLNAFYYPQALPRAYVASNCISNINQESNLKLLLETDDVLRGQINLENNGDKIGVNCENYSAKFKRIPIEYDHGSKLQLASVKGPALITVNNYYYPGWKAIDQLSGESFEIAKANSIFRTVFLPEEREYKIKMDYKPWWLTWVYSLLILALILVIITYFYLGKSQQKNID